jgi:predicted dehydrogenase
MEVKVILVGNGYFGSIYRERIKSNSFYELVGVVDADYDRLTTVEGMTIAENYHAIASNVEHDAVVICSPPNTHMNIAISAMDNGKHVLCAKPGSLSLSDAYYMHGVAKAKNVALVVDYTMLWAMENTFIGSQFAALGVPLSMSSVRNVVTGPKPEGIVWDLLCHDVAMYLHQMGSVLPTTVRCTTSTSLAVAHMYRDDDQLAYLSASYNASHAKKEVLLRCKPHDYFANPRFVINWDQNQRSVKIESQGKHVEAVFRHQPDPISACLDRFHTAANIEDQSNERIFLQYHASVCRILEAFDQSALNDGMIVKVSM